MDAKPDAESDSQPTTEPGPSLDDANSDAPSQDGGAQLTGVKSAPSRLAPPPELTRRYPDASEEVSDDDRDVGWGEAPAPAGRDDDWYLRERPPHHG